MGEGSNRTLAGSPALTHGEDMRWVMSVFILCATLAGASAVYRWDHHVAVPLAMAAIGLVLSCMVLATPSQARSEAAPERRFNQPRGSWPQRGVPAGPDARLYRRR